MSPSCQHGLQETTGIIQQLYYFIWTDLREQDFNSSVYQNQHNKYFKARRGALSPTSLLEQHWRLNTVITALNSNPGNYSNFRKDNSSLMSTWPFLVSKSFIFRMFGESKQIVQPLRRAELYLFVYVYELSEKTQYFRI